MTLPVVRLENINKIHLTEEIETYALVDINIDIQRGEFVSIMGPSGCGKSTLLNILGLLDTPNSGSYYFGGNMIDISSERKRAEIRKSHVGIIFQSFNLIDELTVYQNIELTLLYQNIPAKDRVTKIHNIAEKVGISHRLNHYPQQLSGGQQQRVAIARAVIGEPNLLLADEPTGNLDSQNSIDVMRMLKMLNDEKTTIVMVTHSEEDAKFGDRIIRLFDGKIQ